jgi:hypothetical protein
MDRHHVDLEDLSLPRLAELCRTEARRAEEWAQTPSPERRLTCRTMASEWLLLAREIEDQFCSEAKLLRFEGLAGRSIN